MSRNPGSSWILVAIILLAAGIGAAILSWWLPWQAAQRRVRNERSASRAIVTLAEAESLFRMNDRDGNGIPDFWTGDVATLFKLGLIDRELAEADAFPIVPLVRQPVPKDGYYFAALLFDHSVIPAEDYRQVTDPASGKVHHPQRFGFIAYPAEWGVTGRAIYVVNENNTVFRRRDQPWDGLRRWPPDREIVNFWSKFD